MTVLGRARAESVLSVLGCGPTLSATVSLPAVTWPHGFQGDRRWHSYLIITLGTSYGALTIDSDSKQGLWVRSHAVQYCSLIQFLVIQLTIGF